MSKSGEKKSEYCRPDGHGTNLHGEEAFTYFKMRLKLHESDVDALLAAAFVRDVPLDFLIRGAVCDLTERLIASAPVREAVKLRAEPREKQRRQREEKHAADMRRIYGAAKKPTRKRATKKRTPAKKASKR